MSTILYYSKYCENCKKILYDLGKSKVAKEIHFICVDKRRKDKQGKTFIMLDNGKELLMPNTLTKVPGLLLLYRGNNILYGDNIMNYFRPMMGNTESRSSSGGGGGRRAAQADTRSATEPSAFSFNEMGTMMSDNYSYLDQSASSMSAKGNGGMRQMHSFATLDQQTAIETPPEDYVSTKMTQVNIENLEKERQADMNIKYS